MPPMSTIAAAAASPAPGAAAAGAAAAAAGAAAAAAADIAILQATGRKAVGWAESTGDAVAL